MTIALQNPQLQAFLEAEVREGRYASIDAAVEAAVMRMKREDESDEGEELDEETLRRLEEADAQISRGEYFTIDQVQAMLAAEQPVRQS